MHSCVLSTAKQRHRVPIPAANPCHVQVPFGWYGGSVLSSSFLFPRVPFKLTPYFCKASGHPKVRVWHFYYLDSVGLSLLPVHVALFVCLVI